MQYTIATRKPLRICLARLWSWYYHWQRLEMRGTVVEFGHHALFSVVGLKSDTCRYSHMCCFVYSRYPKQWTARSNIRQIIWTFPEERIFEAERPTSAWKALSPQVSVTSYNELREPVSSPPCSRKLRL
ncbi:hypothetical protein BDY19DRAFT_928209 [Irpex rosettiformis]|uniref:Uncharacterized protein n=1 Tax=Irpex rosettiformis TaxID=378272 RepID=A0ACB8UCS6_9APHY|nr:hypothetical protein BDY19DRAFT_928209 [Irpex rosettiformis]